MKIKTKNVSSFDHPDKGSIEAFINSNTLNKDLDFDSIRAAVKADLPDGVIHQIANDLGYEVES